MCECPGCGSWNTEIIGETLFYDIWGCRECGDEWLEDIDEDDW